MFQARSRKHVFHVLAAVLVAGTALSLNAQPAGAGSAATGAAFSANTPGDKLPQGWENHAVTNQKKSTRYTLVSDGGTTVVQADADGAASALMHPGDIDLTRTPVVSWRWKVSGAIDGADNKTSDKEDAPARLVFFFEGDTSKLALGDRAQMTLAKTLAGEELPYATLMYIWSDSAPVGTLIPNTHTGRVQMLVVSNSQSGFNTWRTVSRDLSKDFERAFHEAPGKLQAYGVLTDTDNTGLTAQARYGDIRFQPGR
jgi:hypothetical protein